MKSILLLTLALLPYLTFSQTDAIDEFYAQHGFRDNTVKIKIGGALIKVGSWFIEEPATRSLVRKAKRARILYSEEHHTIERSEVDHVVREAKRDGYQSIAFVSEGRDKVEVYIREDRKFIRNLLLIIHSEDEFVMASLDCRFTMQDIEAALKEEL